MADIEITLVTEAYNHGEGQSLDALRRALGALELSIANRLDREAVLVDSGRNPRIARLLQEEFPSIRHLQCPVEDYESFKEFAAIHARGRIVAYLDGDCVPASDEWLDRLVAPLRAGTATATCGTTIYEGGGVVTALATIMDFGFLIDSRGGAIGCYASNNVAFLRSRRIATCVPAGPMRCRCYAHAQILQREGDPIIHVPEAVVLHELPGLFSERYRRGYDVVAAYWVDPLLPGAQLLQRGLRAIPQLYARGVRGDWRQIDRPHPWLNFSGRRRIAAKMLSPILRLIDLAGLVRALALGPWRRWMPAQAHEMDSGVRSDSRAR